MGRKFSGVGKVDFLKAVLKGARKGMTNEEVAALTNYENVASFSGRLSALRKEVIESRIKEFGETQQEAYKWVDEHLSLKSTGKPGRKSQNDALTAFLAEVNSESIEDNDEE